MIQNPDLSITYNLWDIGPHFYNLWNMHNTLLIELLEFDGIIYVLG